ncbi:MAG: hypothetical protein K8R58_04155 [Bacteroidales bacterium]|nr:hypothetical protein [Bacteroidales bacterium]
MNIIKNHLLLYGFLLLSQLVLSQDIIYIIDGTSISAKVLEINPKEVIYNDFYNPDGPVYKIKKNQVLKIVYQNNKEEIINGETNIENILYSRNILAYHLFDIIFGDFSISYERISKNGKIGFKIPVCVGYGDENSSVLKNTFYSGFGVNFYPTGQGKWKYFTGPNIKIGTGKEYYWDYYTYPYYYHEKYYKNIFYFKVLIDNGLCYSPIKNFTVSAYVSIGVKYIDESYYEYDDKLSSTAHFSFNLGYRF